MSECACVYECIGDSALAARFDQAPHPVPYSLTHSLTHSPTHPPTHSLTHALTHPLTHLYVVNTGAQAIAAGMSHSMVLKTDGTVWATGRNGFGRLGDGTEIEKNTFVKVSSGQ